MIPLPDGSRIDLDRSVRMFRKGTVLTGGYPGRLITLSHEGADVLGSLLEAGVTSPGSAKLARRLVDAGMAHPRPAPAPVEDARRTVTVVVPVHDRPEALDRCLESVGADMPTVVVDDGSDRPAAITEVCRRHGAHLVSRATNGGPGVARNDALPLVDSPLVAFLDSDCTVDTGWLDGLVPLFDDPELAAVAPRVRPAPRPGATVLARFLEGRSPLDMGDEASEVGPNRKVRYVPTAALVVRRAAVEQLGRGFDPGLRVGEDVDLVWRLIDAGWAVRYEPSVVVTHREPPTWAELLGRRFRYGTSAGPLAARHPGRLAPVELRPWPTATALAFLCGHPLVAALSASAAGMVLGRRLRTHGVPLTTCLRWSFSAAGWTVVGVGHAATVVAGPVLVAALSGRRRRAAAAVLFLPPLVEWVRRRPSLDPLRWSVAAVVDDMAYGFGVWTGCLESGTSGPLVPSLQLHPDRDTPRPGHESVTRARGDSM